MDELHVMTAESGQEGLRLTAEHRPGLILCDVGLPDLSGYSVVREIRQKHPDYHPHIWFITGDRTNIEQDTADELGARGILVKPFGTETLQRIVSEVQLSSGREVPRQGL